MPDLRLPAICDFSITNGCNAACDFCGLARDKTLIGPARYVDTDAYSRALPILYRRGIRYLTLQGGEPLAHPEVVQLVSQTVASGISCAIITNGWFLSRYIKSLAAAGLYQLIVSLDSANLAEHERNRGLDGLERRLAEGIAQAREYGLPVQASVTVNRLVGYDALVPCIGGYKYFYLDWNLDIWRCEAWSEPMGSVFDLDRIPDQREPCNACMMACYRNASMLMHAAVAATDAARATAAGQI